MNALDMQVYKDGNRTILVFNNCKPETDKIISSVISSLMGPAPKIENIKNIVPMQTTEKEMPNIMGIMHNSGNNTMGNIPDINENILYEQKGFEGYVEVYNYYKQYNKQLTPERKMELTNFINMHAARMKTMDPKDVPTEELQKLLTCGLQTIFSNKLATLLQQTTMLTLQDLVNSNRQILEYAYTVCFS